MQKLESTTAPSKDDITVNDSAHSPVIPIPVSSTPASAFISDPPSSAPEVFASPICPPAPSSTPAVTASICDLPFATPEGHVRPPLVFEDIVKRKFGSESVQFTVVIRGNLYCKPAVH